MLGLPKWLAPRVAAAERRINRRLARLDRPTLTIRPAAMRPGLRWLLFGDRPDRADVLATAAQIGRCHPASMVGFRESLNEHERRDALAALSALPVVIMVGGADRLTPVPHARAIADALPTARLVIYPDAGHMLPYERATDVAAHIADLVATVKVD
jgi:pimeloyl-ACP methyl ester carboxylesterase